jgi:predicted PhzF superfamily epimerase YddE/YHI9
MELHVLNVFTAADGSGGNPLGVFLDGAAVPEAKRQPIAHELGYSETVFVDDPESGAIRIFTPYAELPFAGHPTVGTAWFLAQRAIHPGALRTSAGELAIRTDAGRTWIRARPEWSPPFVYVELDSAADVEALTHGDPDQDVYYWAWIDRDRGLIRARGLFEAHGIEEDEATGSAALALSSRLGRAIEVFQGHGSQIWAQPLGDGWAEVGGTTALNDEREFEPR